MREGVHGLAHPRSVARRLILSGEWECCVAQATMTNATYSSELLVRLAEGAHTATAVPIDVSYVGAPLVRGCTGTDRRPPPASSPSGH